uniref:PpiC-type peptidyl-prolyl cis-trans isomerase n=1 Tax=uncultured bacterium FLS12 TaxID=651659 RepID=C5HLB4_9BACT|nr:PpiC-type peptidyl-prolyl cis-trans isomerase [uncultured bacterium FLS12]
MLAHNTQSRLHGNEENAMALVVNGERVEEARIENEARQIEANPELAVDEQDPDKRKEAVQAMAKDHVVTGVLINQEVARRHMSIPPHELEAAFEAVAQQQDAKDKPPEQGGWDENQADAVKKNLEMRMKIDRLLDEVCRDVPEPTEEDVLACYEESKDRFAVPEMIHAAHIVKHVQDGNIMDRQAAYNEMKDIANEIDKGATFEELAARHSDCPDSGGDLGVFPRGQMVQEFEDVVFALEVGQVSGIFSSCFGLHIAKLYERRPRVDKSFDEVADEVRKACATELENTRIDAFVDELKASAVIEED